MKCLDAVLAEPGGDDYYHGLLIRRFRTADVLKIGPAAFRAGLALVALWPLPPDDAQDADEAVRDPGAHLIWTAVSYASEYDARRVYTAIRGDAEDGEHGRGWRPLSWSVLEPLTALKGYDDLSIAGGRDAICYGPPTEWSYRYLPAIREQYARVEDGITRALEACQEYFQAGNVMRREILAGDAPIDESLLDRISRDELQRMANEERERQLARYFRRGDRALNLPLMQNVELSLRDQLAAVQDHRAYLDTLVGQRPKLVERGGRNVEPYRAIAAAVNHRISAALAATDQRRRNAFTSNKPGTFRGEALERTATIMRAVYGVSMTPEDVKAAAQKRPRDKAESPKK